MTSPSSRILTLLSLLQVRRDSSATFLAERLGVSPRTVRRDVERLRELGYTVTTLRGPAGGYRLSAGAELPPLLFDDDQAVAVALALAVAPASGTAIGEAAARALGTVRQVMPSRLRHRMDSIEVLSTPSAVVVDPEVLVAVIEATSAHEVLRFDYAPVWGEAEVGPPLSVEPHAVVTSNGRWYLLAWAPAADDWRTYRIDRMHPRAATRRSFSRRPCPATTRSPSSRRGSVGRPTPPGPASARRCSTSRRATSPPTSTPMPSSSRGTTVGRGSRRARGRGVPSRPGSPGSTRT
ncbi:helix-turn-helix transcriptional regulator [Frigoribacterium sp. VKM Ac-2530]|uniref:helix-turn-helix transcriptional regulator n=1 Tax=Frigoribacterium sp. VKM Ac-2530 TaxID=2783822 RepID=UPI00351C244F